MKVITTIVTIVALAALSGCYSIRDLHEWTDHHENIINMLINCNNHLSRRVGREDRI